VQDTSANARRTTIDAGLEPGEDCRTAVRMSQIITRRAYRLRLITVTTAGGASMFGGAELLALHCCGFRNMTEHSEHA
jgi:hypothetical protein